MKQAKSEEIGEILINSVFSKYCVLDYIIMDPDNAFMSSLMSYLFKKLGIKIKTMAPYNHQSLQTEHGIKSLSNILPKHLTKSGYFKMRRLALLNKDREYFQYNSGDLVYLISPLTSQLRTASRKIMVKYVGPLVVYKIIDLHNYLLMTLDGKLLRGLFEHERINQLL